MNVLLSIKPKYVEKILDGEKRYEFRKTSFKNPEEVEKIYIYSTSPEKKIVGYFVLDEIIEDEPENLWERCKTHSGVEKEEFFEYYRGKEKGVAMKINRIEDFKEPIDPYENLSDFVAPQSFYYVGKEFVDIDNN